MKQLNDLFNQVQNLVVSLSCFSFSSMGFVDLIPAVHRHTEVDCCAICAILNLSLGLHRRMYTYVSLSVTVTVD